MVIIASNATGFPNAISVILLHIPLFDQNNAMLYSCTFSKLLLSADTILKRVR